VSLLLRLVLFSSFAAIMSAQSIGELVSVEELRNPLTGKPLLALLTAQKHLKSGQHELGMQELQDALSDPVAMPYAISMVGVEHLKAGLLDTAIGDLEQAVQLLPGRPENRANLSLRVLPQGATWARPGRSSQGAPAGRRQAQNPPGSRDASAGGRLSRCGGDPATPGGGRAGS